MLELAILDSQFCANRPNCQKKKPPAPSKKQRGRVPATKGTLHKLIRNAIYP
jgi:hypothetical protein